MICVGGSRGLRRAQLCNISRPRNPLTLACKVGVWQGQGVHTGGLRGEEVRGTVCRGGENTRSHLAAGSRHLDGAKVLWGRVNVCAYLAPTLNSHKGTRLTI